MKWLARILVIPVVLSLPACGLARQAEEQKRFQVAQAELPGALQECIDRHKRGEIKTFSARATCMTDTENRIARPVLKTGGDLLTLRQATRASLAEKVDRKAISEADAQLEMAKVTTEIVSEDQKRTNANRAINAQEAAVAAANSPVTCSRYGRTVTCF